MILQSLNHLYERLASQGEKISPQGYSDAKIDFCLVLDEAGKIVEVTDLRMDDKKRSSRMISAPQVQRTGNVKSSFLWDKTAYVLGVSHTSKRVTDEHAEFKRFHHLALGQSDDKGLVALLAFLESWSPNQIDDENSVFTSYKEELIDRNVVFRLQGENGYLHHRIAAQEIWSQQQATGESPIGQCLILGRELPIARLHPLIKNVDGAQSSGAAIVSFNNDAFCSYGKEQGQNAPVSEQVAFTYTTALNYLLRRDSDNHQRLKIGDAITVFWAEAAKSEAAEAAESFMSEAFQPTDSQESQALANVLLQVAQGKPLKELRPDLEPNTRFYVLGLSPNAARLSVRFWYVSSLDDMAKHLAAHYQDLYLEPVPWRNLPPIWQLTYATAPIRDGKSKADDVPPLLAGELARAILTGQKYPTSLLAQIIMRMRADGAVTGIRVALCKAVINRSIRLTQSTNQLNKEVPMSLDIEELNAGYRLGRLFAVLEGIQRESSGKDINATIRDRYWGAASATPASIFPMLIRNSMNHLSKIRKDPEKSKLSGFFDKQIGDIQQGIPTHFPRSLNLQDQGRFAIGYYHQRFTRKVKSKDGVEIENILADDAIDSPNTDSGDAV